MKPRRAEVAVWASLSINMIERSAESRLEDVRASGQVSESGFGLRSHRPTRRSCARRGARRAERWNDGRGRGVRPFASLRPVSEPATPRSLETPRRTRAAVRSASLSSCLLSSFLAVVSAMFSLGITGSSMRRGEAIRADVELGSRVKRSGDVALGITGSSMGRSEVDKQTRR